MLFRLFTIMAVVALAISTWVLSTPGRTPNRESAAPQAQMPSYYLKTAILTDYDESGIPSVRIAAERIDQIANGPEVALHDVRVDYQPSTGPSWVMTGDLAHVESGGQAVDVTGNVRMLGNLLGDPSQPVAIGAAVQGVFEHHERADPPYTLLQWRAGK